MSKAARINGPGEAVLGSDQYQQDCLFALEPSVIKLIELAAEAGWDQQQAVYAIMCIAALQVKDRTLFVSDFIGPEFPGDADGPFPGSIRFMDNTFPGFAVPPDGRALSSLWEDPADLADDDSKDP